GVALGARLDVGLGLVEQPDRALGEQHVGQRLVGLDLERLLELVLGLAATTGLVVARAEDHVGLDQVGRQRELLVGIQQVGREPDRRFVVVRRERRAGLVEVLRWRGVRGARDCGDERQRACGAAPTVDRATPDQWATAHFTSRVLPASTVTLTGVGST